MNRDSYNRLRAEVFGLINKDALSEVLELKRSATRVDGIQDLIRTAIMESSIGKYKSLPYFFNGRIYEKMSHDDFSNLIYDLMKDCNLPLGDYARVRGISDLCLKAISNKELRPNKSLIVFSNYVLDTKTRKKHRFNKNLVQMSAVDYPYDEEVVAHQWRFLLEALLPDKRDRRILQESLGCLLLNRGSISFGHMTFFHGVCVNSKNIVFDTLSEVFGRDNVGNFSLTSLLGGNDKRGNLAVLDGLWANFSRTVQDIDISKYEDAFVSLVSGRPMEARQVFGDNYVAQDIPLLFASISKMPVIENLTNAIKRSIVIIDFKIDLPEDRSEHHLSKVFRDEYSGIINWIMDGRDAFVKNGYDFTDRAYINSKMDMYHDIGNSVLRFMYSNKYHKKGSNVSDTVPRWVKSTYLYNAYLRWCMDNEITPESMHHFGGILYGAGYMRRRSGHGNQYAIFGTSVLNDFDSQTVTPRRKSDDEDSKRPYMIDGREYINSQTGIGKLLHVNTSLVSLYRKAGLLAGCYHMDGRVIIFDVAKMKMRLKQIGIYMTDEQREAIKAKLKEEARKRGLFNAEMKRNNSLTRIYKSPEDEMLIRLRNSIQREERKLLSKEVRRLEKRFDSLTNKVDNEVEKKKGGKH